MSEPVSYKSTRMACCRGYIVQGIVNNISPLFFVIFQREFGISYAMISSLILFNFTTQILVDLLCVRFVDRMGYRAAAVMAHVCSTLGLVLLGLLPKALPSPFLGLAAATVISAIGGGMIEVIISPIVDSLPSTAKDAKMSLLHSFYCWGQVAVVLLTTLAVRLLGESLWWALPLFWALIPAYNCVAFANVPLRPAVPADEKSPLKSLLRSGAFAAAMVLMLCAGAAELAMSQWSSLFAEKALGVPKVMGDLLGPCLFAVFMGLGRTIYGLWGERPDLDKALLATAVLCAGCYLGAALLSVPLLSLLCCSLCGFSISLMWPGVLSSTAAAHPKGGTAMFGVLAVCGDIGCSAGPALTGAVSDLALRLGCTEPQGLKAGMLAAALFPAVLVFCLLLARRLRGRGKAAGPCPAPREPF